MNLPESAHKLPKIQLLKLLLSNYPEWQEWFQSNKCWLYDREKLAVFHYLRYEDLTITAQNLGITKERARQIFSKAIWKLIRAEPYYEEWIQSKLKTANNNEEITPEILEFLHSPLNDYHYSMILYRGLERCKFKTAAEVLKYSYTELMLMKKFGKRPLEMFVQLLKEHDCDFLIRDLEEPQPTLAALALEDYILNKL